MIKRSTPLLLLLFALIVSCDELHAPDEYLPSVNPESEDDVGWKPEEVLDFYIVGAGEKPEKTATVLADGATTVTLKAKIPRNADSDKRMITFTTTTGTFVSGGKDTLTQKVDASGETTVQLVSPNNEGAALVQASISEIITRQITVNFERALPEKIDVDPGTFSVKASASENTTVTAHLRRSSGKPTPGFQVNFAAKNSDGNRIGQFRDVKLSDANGSATALFTVGNTAYRGTVTIEASVEVAGTMTTGSADVTVIAP